MARTDMREQLLAAGLRTIHTGGFTATGVQEIADAAGAPKGSFYNHFKSKEEFAVAVLDRYFAEQGKTVQRFLSDETLTPRERLRAYFARMVEVISEGEFMGGCLIGNLSLELADHSKLIRDRLSVLLAGWTKALANCIREAQRAGEIGSDLDADTLAEFVINAWEGAILRTKVEKNTAPLINFQRLLFGKVLV
jgi:TetR/AcrR family transcriptional regulator, transcriptional repressor for nem operon